MVGSSAHAVSIATVILWALIPAGFLMGSGANAQSIFGRSFGSHGFGESIFGDGFSWPYHGHSNVGQGRHDQKGFPRHYGGDPFDLTYDDGIGRNYYNYRCPEYQPATISRWHETRDGHVAVRVAIPGVHPGNRKVWLGDDGSTVYIQAARSLSVSGGRRCLPRGAKVSTDGHAEILDVSVPTPPVGVVPGQTVIQDLQGGGVVLLVPRSSASQVRVESLREPVSKYSPATPASAPAAPPCTSCATRKSTPTRHQALPTSLPPADDIEVIDEEWPAPEKLPDAAEGWWDNRGEFHEY